MNQVEDFQHINSEHPQIPSHAKSYSNRGSVLPASFLSSRACKASQVADSLALCQSTKKLSFFITITINPNWPLIQASISKTNHLCSVRSVRLTLLTRECKSPIRTQPPYYTTPLMQPDTAPNPQDTPGTAPNTQDAIRS